MDPNQLDPHIAKALCTKFHAGQMYGSLPYMYHLQEVVESVKTGSTDDRMIAVAYLHDILEDTACTKEILEGLFEDKIVEAVVDITRRPQEPKDVYLNRVKANHMARTVKIHDSLCNLRASVKRFDARRIKKYTGQIAYLVDDAPGPGPLTRLKVENILSPYYGSLVNQGAVIQIADKIMAASLGT